ncbi:MAG TPA: response regulator, partial [Chthoniobacterales bacterium]|nr:response regulator [Chthoniobacterales bacterium]
QRRHGGLGLGLAISKSIADGHGALLEAMSDGRSRGATFRLTIAVVESPATAPARPEKGWSDENGERRGWRILLVEDHADTAAALRNLLARRGHRVSVAHDLRSAREAARGDPFDLLISDVGLPDGTGAELMSQLRTNGMRGIAISGFGMSGDVEKSLAAGFTEHLVKPVNFETLEAAMLRAMRVAAD